MLSAVTQRKVRPQGERLEGEGVGVFDLAEDEGAVEGADAVEVAEDAEDEFLV